MDWRLHLGEEWQSFRTRQNRDLELITSERSYDRPGRYTVAVKVIDIFLAARGPPAPARLKGRWRGFRV
jgi:hypothetical protein